MKLSNAGKTILAVLFLLIAYWPVSSLQFTMKYDMMDWFYPMRSLIGDCLQNKILPLWNPYTNLGYPIHVDPQSGALYPVVWVLGWLFGYSVSTINMEFMLHIIIGFFGMKKLAETVGVNKDTAILVGLSYACCGFFVSNAQHISWIISASWLPFVAVCYLKLLQANHWKYALWLSIGCFMLLTGGYPAFTITAFYLMGFAFLGYVGLRIKQKRYLDLRRFVLNNVLFGIAFLLQSAVFLKYFLESLPFLIRTESLSLEEIQILPFSPPSFLSFILPFATGGNTAFFKTDISMANAYIGLVGLSFVLFFLWEKPKRKTIVLWCIAIFFLLVAIGDSFVLRAWLYHYVPMMNLFRYPSLFRIFSLISLLLLFGLAFQNFKNTTPDKPKWWKIRTVLIALIIVLGGITVYAIQKTSFALPQEFSAAAIVAFFNQSNNSEMVLIQGPVQLLFLFLFLLKTYWKKGLSFIKFAVIILLVDLFLSVQLNAFLTITSEANLSQLEQKIDELPKEFPIPDENISAVSHHGNKTFYPIWYNFNIIQKRVANDGYNNFKFRAYRSFKEQPEHMKILENKLLFDSSEKDTATQSVQNTNSVKITAFSPNHVQANLSFEKTGEVTLLQYYYPGWKAWLDDEPVEIFKREDIFLAVEVPAGQHQIRLEYYPNHFLLYLLVSVVTFISLLLFLIGHQKYATNSSN